jgi:hypothetical protein
MWSYGTWHCLAVMAGNRDGTFTRGNGVRDIPLKRGWIGFKTAKMYVHIQFIRRLQIVHHDRHYY